MEISTSSGNRSTSCTLLDQPVGFKCLASLLGVGGSRLGKKASGNPDLRYGQHAHQSKPGTWTVDGFLQVAYDAIAETLPDEFLSKDCHWLSPQIAVLFVLMGKHIKDTFCNLFRIKFTLLGALKHMETLLNTVHGVYRQPFLNQIQFIGPLHQIQVCPKRKGITQKKRFRWWWNERLGRDCIWPREQRWTSAVVINPIMQNNTAAPQPAGEKIFTSRNCDGFVWALQVNTEIVGMPCSLAPSTLIQQCFCQLSTYFFWFIGETLHLYTS